MTSNIVTWFANNFLRPRLHSNFPSVYENSETYILYFIELHLYELNKFLFQVNLFLIRVVL